MTDNFPLILTNPLANEKKTDFRIALMNLNKSIISNENVVYLITTYHATKQLDFRSKILKLLYDFKYPLLHEFFSSAYKKERYLNLKIYAMRGLSNYIDEKETNQLLKKFNQTLVKRQQTTPYNYQEYELLRGKNALPFLAEKYNYSCFAETLEQVNRQYNDMPDAFKGHYTIDENGEIIMLRSPRESKRIIEEFWEAERRKLR